MGSDSIGSLRSWKPSETERAEPIESVSKNRFERFGSELTEPNRSDIIKAPIGPGLIRKPNRIRTENTVRFQKILIRNFGSVPVPVRFFLTIRTETRTETRGTEYIYISVSANVTCRSFLY